ncbi:DegT/DnrJ/EryC1/StrS aminotransferase family protein [Paenibacillus sp. J22TS3]|uniref:DegT/DnrJ/EryC1/StrS family aminotransferase n=1 Tax=Paenibacillus sp. J22TS3 TaxID=2807192 RepID=UPI001B10700B|nr:DegT/DnrJ/EryC1/StrS family aminotransferase [Paenibacillus sp. J22TS3]GIP21752.1 aminotransferase DegT [Paenibacillus sp. J22TS3]
MSTLKEEEYISPIYVTKPYLPNEEKYKDYISKIFRSGHLTNHGPLVRELEERLAEFLGVNRLLLVSNGTLALQVAYKLLGLRDEVITTPFSFIATSSSLAWQGLTPVFADIDERSFNINANEIEDKITERTTGIVPVHVFGNACEIAKIEEIAKRYKLKVVYDAAHAFDVKYKGQNILNYGDISTLSFHATKIFHSIEGGALIINDEETYRRARSTIDFGIQGPDVIQGIGINAKMNEFQAAMGLCVLDDIKKIMKNRKDIYKRYHEAFAGQEEIQVQRINQDCSQNYSYFPIVLRSEECLIRVKQSLEQNKIFPRRYFHPSLNTIDYLKSPSMDKSESLSKRILCLPMYDSFNIFDQLRVIRIVKEAI